MGGVCHLKWSQHSNNKQRVYKHYYWAVGITFGPFDLVFVGLEESSACEWAKLHFAPYGQNPVASNFWQSFVLNNGASLGTSTLTFASKCVSRSRNSCNPWANVHLFPYGQLPSISNLSQSRVFHNGLGGGFFDSRGLGLRRCFALSETESFCKFKAKELDDGDFGKIAADPSVSSKCFRAKTKTSCMLLYMARSLAWAGVNQLWTRPSPFDTILGALDPGVLRLAKRYVTCFGLVVSHFRPNLL